MGITLRPVQESDDSFLFDLYASTRAAEMALVPWTEQQKEAFLRMQFTAQKNFYAQQYPKAQHAIICCDGESVGRLYLAREINRFHILDITIAADRRGSGVGAAVLQGILREASQVSKPTTIYIENFNSAMRLFERLGFRVAESKDFLILLERPPSAFSDAASAPE